MSAKPWTKAHQIEVARWFLRAAEGAAMAGDVDMVQLIADLLGSSVSSRKNATDSMYDIGLSTKEAARAMRRIDDFAEGRRVREVWWRVGDTTYKQRAAAVKESRHSGHPLVTVRGTRRVK